MKQDVLNRAHQLLTARKPDWSLEQPFYVDPDFFDMEMELFFTRQWLFAAMTCEIPAAGDWIKVDIGRESVIVLRKADGQIAAYHNTCRHRGSRICLGEKGRARRLVCPYHQWSYELTGQLARTRLMGDDFSTEGFGLAPVAVGVVGGYIFLNLSDDPPAFEPFRAATEPYLLPHDLDNAKVVHTQSLVEQANWKLVIENNRECYHCAGSHPELMHIITEFDDPNDPNVSPAYKALLLKKGADWDALCLPHAHTETSPQYRAVRLPFTGGMVSMTMDGRPGCSRLLGNLTSPDLGSVRLLHLPNTWNHILADHAVTFRVFPVSAEETLVTTKWLVHKDAVEGVDYDVARLTEVWAETNNQDRQLAENNHLGIRGRAYRSGPYSDLIEGGTRDFVRWYAENLLGALDPLVDTAHKATGHAA
ncbi:aromatic ring-hydroxylating oxygenase subunit alpha [Paracoccus shanxieyensis]|uniref:Rieske 2Fe-2S domain-containing protein n=1 Tax=Paracoccus shanxieyensis TaxID=2675752 RepID=A0A6L6IW81_9RHOB|nr:aromatic ring-hydroxylating dioxygenase subunit alpha [Paracoccus shanxieyensis]MTH62854.1 Rieske 2Fe-2S domain-containing protein [Paracoccus shanxieyensis]MTH86062.1 Rieske 2Fe-2S domain-containing protein [Paracoccus shanxieyensis]